MGMHAEAMAILEGLPEGWEWSVSKYGHWYHVVIGNDGLWHEPCYTTQDMKTGSTDKQSLLKCVQFAFAEYEKGEAAAKVKLATAM